jgi:hypothetical protein
LSRVTQDRDILRDRGRRPKTQASTFVQPLSIRFDDRLDISDDNLPNIVNQVRRYPHSSVTFLSERPYPLATVTDREDGSAFDLGWSGQNTMTLIPHLRTTGGALTRFCRYVYDDIGEASFGDDADGYARDRLPA